MMINRISFCGNPYRSFQQKAADYAGIERLNSKLNGEVQAIKSNMIHLISEKSSMVKQSGISLKEHFKIKKRLSKIEAKIKECAKKLEEKENIIRHAFYDYHERL